MPFEGFSLAKTLATFGIMNAADSLLQNISRIVCLLFAFLAQVTHYRTAVKICLKIYRLKNFRSYSLIAGDIAGGGVYLLFCTESKVTFKLAILACLSVLPLMFVLIFCYS